jgi:hypothetical protein
MLFEVNDANFLIVSPPSLSGEGRSRSDRGGVCFNLARFRQTPPGRALLGMRVHPPLKGRESHRIVAARA